MGGQDITIRPETAADHDAIRHVNQEAFDLIPSRCTSGNERITRKTEVADDFPIQVVCDWIGNTESVAAKHYLQVTEDHFTKALQNALRHPAVLPRRGSQPELLAHEKTPVLQGFAAGCEVVQSGRVEDRGLEPGAFPCGHTGGCRAGGAESGANETGLVSVIDA